MTTFPKTVLIIDDSQESREIFRLYLEKNDEPGFRIIQSESAETGWELFLSECPDCVLLDYHIPGGNGLELMAKMIHGSQEINPPVLLLTNHGDEMIARDALKNGAADYLVKRKVTAEGLTRAILQAIEKATLIRQAEEQRHEIERSHGELEQFSHRASHDLQAPLRRIISYLELIEKDPNSHITEQSKGYFGRCLTNAHQMQKLIKSLLEYSLIGGSRKSFCPVKLSETVQEVLLQLDKTIQDTQATVTVMPLPEVFGHDVFLQQLFLNLLDNAIKYCGERPPVVDVAVYDHDTFWQVQVRDHGVGIPLEFQTKIFEVFQRLDQSSKRKSSGIGLAICKKVIELHGGKIWVNSVEGQGSTFSLTFPKMAPDDSRQSLSHDHALVG